MVVSEIGEQWSPQTAPAMQAEMAMIIIRWSVCWKASTTMGIRIPKVPQEVPVAKDSRQPIRKIMAGRKFISPTAEPFTISATKAPAARSSVMDFRVQAKVRIRMAGTMALKPSGRQAMHFSKVSTRRIIKRMTVITRARKDPSISPTEALLPAKASTRLVPEKKPRRVQHAADAADDQSEDGDQQIRHFAAEIRHSLPFCWRRAGPG